jgi:hypothetical protein
VNIAGCSSDISNDTDLKYWSCNYNGNCTNNYIVKPPGFYTSSSTGNLITLTPKNTWVFQENFCNYQLEFPSAASYNDVLSFKVNLQSRIKIYYMFGTSYSDAGVTQKGWA